MRRSRLIPAGVIVLCSLIVIVIVAATFNESPDANQPSNDAGLSLIEQSLRQEAEPVDSNSPADNQHGPLVRPLPPQEMAALHEQIVEKRKDFVSADGMRVYFPMNGENRRSIEDVVFLKIKPIMRTLTGDIGPADSLSYLDFSSTKGSGAGTAYAATDYSSICVGLTEKPDPSALLIGDEYDVLALRQGKRVGTAHLKTPTDIEKGGIYQVDLLVIDKVQDRIEQRKKEELQEEQRLTVRLLKGPPSLFDSNGLWEIAYQDVSTNRSCGPSNYDDGRLARLPADLVFEGLQTIGGELVVMHIKPRDTCMAWLYKQAVSTRTLNLPQDADFVFDGIGTVEIEILVENANLMNSSLHGAKGYRGVGFYATEKAEFPLAYVFAEAFAPSPTTAGVATKSLRVKSGHYYARAVLRRDTLVSLAELDITEELGHSYVLTLPELPADPKR
jgi:hypothetical protein